MLPPANEYLKRLGSFSDGLYLGSEHMNPCGRFFAASQGKGFAQAVRMHQPGIQDTQRLFYFCHSAPFGALCSLALRAAGIALAFVQLFKEAFSFGFFALVDGLPLGSTELGRLWLVPCFGWLMGDRCGPGWGRCRVSRNPQVGIQGDAKEGVKGDTEIVGFGACCCVEGVGESEGIGHDFIMTSF
jgi:hypothetical protein